VNPERRRNLVGCWEHCFLFHFLVSNDHPDNLATILSKLTSLSLFCVNIIWVISTAIVILVNGQNAIIKVKEAVQTTLVFFQSLVEPKPQGQSTNGEVRNAERAEPSEVPRPLSVRQIVQRLLSQVHTKSPEATTKERDTFEEALFSSEACQDQGQKNDQAGVVSQHWAQPTGPQCKARRPAQMVRTFG